MKLAIKKIGKSYSVIFPKQLLDNLHVKPGDDLYVSESTEGIILTPYDPHFETAMKAYEEFSQKYQNSLKKLAKGLC